MGFTSSIRICLPLLLFVAASACPQSNHDSYANASVDNLIDDLTLIDSQAPGIDSAGIYDGFFAVDSSPNFEMGVLGEAAPKIPPQMRELVRRGAAALPALVAHISDARPTKLSVGNDDKASDKRVGVNFFMFTEFDAEYDARAASGSKRMENLSPSHSFTGKYTVKVGDVCYALIGQIVDRILLPVRYQPTAGLIVNSPIETPILAEEVKHDWANTSGDALKASLLNDLHKEKEPYRYGPALVRLSFYFPDAYRVLSGEDLKKKSDFEATIRNQKN